MYLIVSTLPHLLSALPVVQYYYTYTFVYTNIILLSSTCSWHLVNAAKCYYVSYLIGQASPTRFVLPTPKSTHCILRDP